jgi:23S rRNA (cytosine1962-C5)-methyltransferase
MRFNRFRRYQLNKKAQIQVRKHHPWVFQGNLSSAASIFSNGTWLQLFDGKNDTVGFGVFSCEDSVSIRVFHFGESLRNRFFFKLLREAWKARESLVPETNAIRLVNGEADRLPGITVDLYDSVAVIQYYSTSLYRLARLVSLLLPHVLPEPFARSIYVRSANRMGQTASEKPSRWTRGKPVQNIEVYEGNYRFLVDLEQGQKGGFYLDLRGVRRELETMNFSGMKVLNLFSYTGAFSTILQKLGATDITSVDQSCHAQDLHRKNLLLNGLDPGKDRLVCSDVFRFLANLDSREKYDFIILDPPAMASKRTQVPLALRKLEQLHRMALCHLNEESMWFSISCTSRIMKEDLITTVGKVSKNIVGKGRTHIIKDLNEEIDHKVISSFPEGKYLNQILFSNFRA